MRWLILGPYPPQAGEGSEVTAVAAAERLRDGDDVVVVSPLPTAAHDHGPLAGFRALWRVGRRVGTERALWARVESGVLLSHGASRIEALLERVLLAVVLRRAPHAVLDVGDVALFPGGRAGALVFAAVDELVVHSADARAHLVAAGASPAKLTLVERRADGAPPDAVEPSRPAVQPVEVPPPDVLRALPLGAARDDIERAIRARAAEAPVSRALRR